MKNYFLNNHGFMGFDLTIRKRLDVLRNIKNSDVVDIGCGHYGYISHFLSKNRNYVLGLDNDEDAIRHAKERHIEGNNLKFMVFDINNLDRLKEKFDYAVCMEVMEHIKDDRKLLRNINNLLVDGGKLILSTVREDSYISTHFQITDQYRKGYNIRKLKTKLEQAGFEMTNFTTCSGYITQRLLATEYKLRSIKAIEYNQIYRAFLFSLLYPFTFLDTSKDNLKDMTIIVEAEKR